MSHIAQFNWAYLRAPWGHPDVAGFCDRSSAVNLVATRSAGFVWRAPLEDADLTPLRDLVRVTDGPFDPDRMAATLSVWQSVEALEAFVHKSVHARFLRQRADWFVPQGVPGYVVWPVAVDHRPDLSEAVSQMRQLQEQGPSDAAFDLAAAGAVGVFDLEARLA